jgi:hypothetical protein
MVSSFLPNPKAFLQRKLDYAGYASACANPQYVVSVTGMIFSPGYDVMLYRLQGQRQRPLAR